MNRPALLRGRAPVIAARVFIGIGVGLAVFLAPALAMGDGAFPDAQGLLTPAALPDEYVLATNFGLITSLDGAQTWTWSCEQDGNSFGFLYQLAAPPSNRLFALSLGRIVYSDDLGCTWRVAGGALAGSTLQDFFVSTTDANRVIAIASASGAASYQVFASNDGGATFGDAIYTAVAGDTLTGVEIARAAPATVYLTLVSGSARTPKLGRSTDGGAHFTFQDLGATLPGITSLRIVAVDPQDANKVLLRAGGAVGGMNGEELVVTDDGGATVHTPVTLPGGLLTAFARTADGTELLTGVSGVDPVAYRSTDGAGTFQPLPTPPNVRGLAARGDSFYVVADNFNDGYAIGVSKDHGATWSALLRYDQVQAIAACVKTQCLDNCGLQSDTGLWAADVCDATPNPLPVDAGAGGTGGGMVTGTGGGGGAADAAAPDAAGDQGTAGGGGGGGCRCATAPETTSRRQLGAAVLAWATALTVTTRRRRGRRDARVMTRAPGHGANPPERVARAR